MLVTGEKREETLKTYRESCSVLGGRGLGERAWEGSSPLSGTSCTEHLSSSASRISPPGEGRVSLGDNLMSHLVVVVGMSAAVGAVVEMEEEEDWAEEVHSLEEAGGEVE